jgi:hypothetical protein
MIYERKLILKESRKFPLNNCSKEYVKSQKLHLRLNNSSNKQK